MLASYLSTVFSSNLDHLSHLGSTEIEGLGAHVAFQAPRGGRF
jgi:hypothetical protein